MARILIALSTCHEGLVTAPLAKALAAAGHDVRLMWAGDATGLAHAHELGMPELPTTRLDPALDGDGPAAVCTASLAARALDGADALLTIGTGAVALAAAHVAREAGCRVIRLDAGVRPAGRTYRAHQLADRAADNLCVADEQARATLLQEAFDVDDVRVVGSMLPDALPLAADASSAAASDADAPYLWLAFEHRDSHARCSGGVRRLFELCRTAASEAGLALHAVPTALRAPALEAGLTLTDVFCDDDSPRAQLRRAIGARVVVTDSLGHQQLAAAAGVPCVVLASAGRGYRDDLVASGHLHVAGGCTELPATIAAALTAPRPQPLAAPEAAERIRAAVEGWTTTATDGAEPSEGPAALPSEADASGRTFDARELANLTAVLRSGTLNSTRGTFVHRFEREFATWLGARHAIACSSGSAAVHCAIAALGLEAGDEVITTPITDMGALTPMFYEGLVPVFADVDPSTLNVTAATIEAQLTDRTRAIVVTHLFGQPCEMDAILALSERTGLPLIEDAAQAFGATWRDRKVGTFGRLAAFSLQQGKHITTGEGGVVCTDDEELARRVFLFVNKAWGYGDPKPDHYFPALNYRMTELQGAVACGQLPKLEGVVTLRSHYVAANLLLELEGLAGIGLPRSTEHGQHSYWKFPLRVDPAVVPGGALALGKLVREQGVACVPRYVQKPAFECQLFREWRRSPVTSLPLSKNPRGAADGPLFDRADYPGAVRGLDEVVVVPINERYSLRDIARVVHAIRRAHQELTQ